MYCENRLRTIRRGMQSRGLVVLLAVFVGIMNPLVAPAFDKGEETGFQKYAIEQRDKPFPMDCLARHGKYFAPVEKAGNQVGLPSINGNSSVVANHNQALSRQGYSGKFAEYIAPDVELTTDDRIVLSLTDLLNTNKPVMLNFIFTTCTTICPVLTASFTQVQELLGERVDEVLMISITIDPEYDTPEKLAEYSERFKAGAQWKFLTGRIDDIIVVEKAFDIYRGSKTNHDPVTFLRGGKSNRWLRMEGFAKAAEIVAEYEKLSRQDG